MTELQQVYLGIAVCVLGLIVSTLNVGRNAAQTEKKRLKEKWCGKGFCPPK